MKKNITLAPTTLKLQTEEEAGENAMRLLKRIGLEEKADSYPNQLSGGQKRRVAIAGVLAMKPEVLILDEPTAGLDPKGRDDILGLVARLHAEQGMTVILVSHSIEQIERMCSKVAWLSHGHLKMNGDTETVCNAYKAVQRGEA